MALEALIDALPLYAADIRTNISRVTADPALTEQQTWGCLVACAFAVGEPYVIGVVDGEAGARLSETAADAARTAATIMAMNTVYYGAVNLFRNHDYRADDSQLSMQSLATPGVHKIDFELWALAVSALSNCEACLNSHENELHKRGVSIEAVQAALRIASVVNAVSVVLRAEKARVA